MRARRAFLERLAMVRGWRLLACPDPKPATVVRWARGRSDEELAIAARLPDHSPAGRAAVQDVMAARSAAPMAEPLEVPRFLDPLAVRLGRGLSFNWAQSVRQVTGALALAAFLASACASVGANWFQGAAFSQGLAEGRLTPDEFHSLGLRIGFSPPLDDELRARVADLAPARAAQALGQLGWGLAIVFAAALSVWAGAVALRLRPARIVVLRPPEGERGLVRDADRLIARELRPFGHVIALTDRPLKRARFAWTAAALSDAGGPLRGAWLILSSPARILSRLFDKSRYGAALVSSARDFRALARRLADRMALNFEVALSPKEAFLVRATEAWRPEVAGLLMRSADVIVFDASASERLSSLDVAALRAEGLLARTVFVCRADRRAAAQAALSARLPDTAAPLIVYRSSGAVEDRKALHAALSAASQAAAPAA